MSKFRGRSALFKKNFYLKMKEKSLSEIKDIKSNIDLKIDQKWYIYELVGTRKKIPKYDLSKIDIEDFLTKNNLLSEYFALNEKDDNYNNSKDLFSVIFIYYTILYNALKKSGDDYKKSLILSFIYQKMPDHDTGAFAFKSIQANIYEYIKTSILKFFVNVVKITDITLPDKKINHYRCLYKFYKHYIEATREEIRIKVSKNITLDILDVKTFDYIEKKNKVDESANLVNDSVKRIFVDIKIENFEKVDYVIKESTTLFDDQKFRNNYNTYLRLSKMDGKNLVIWKSDNYFFSPLNGTIGILFGPKNLATYGSEKLYLNSGDLDFIAWISFKLILVTNLKREDIKELQSTIELILVIYEYEKNKATNELSQSLSTLKI